MRALLGEREVSIPNLELIGVVVMAGARIGRPLVRQLCVGEDALPGGDDVVAAAPEVANPRYPGHLRHGAGTVDLEGLIAVVVQPAAGRRGERIFHHEVLHVALDIRFATVIVFNTLR